MYPGTDLIEINRVSKALSRTPKLKMRLFTTMEIVQCEQKGNPLESFAGRFAAKEAVLKALGTGLRGLNWVDIEVVNNDLGRPEVRLYGAALELARQLGIYEIKISISHSRDLAVAFALALTREGRM
ncbi:MAG TPA: holo-ACP synthase [Candidatus Deferrimicrobium sp.]|nr:holo-ACP synthase [Candidatus Deferrimicrobium sp.]